MTYLEKKELLKEFTDYITEGCQSDSVERFLDHTDPNPICANCGEVGATELHPLCRECEKEEKKILNPAS